jgi:CheY-like chemotaxis protein
MEKKPEFDIDRSRILVVEDNDLMRTYVTDLIESFGYAVVSATNSMEAMRMIGENDNIAMVFTDITMPGLDGIVLADMLKQHRPQLKILYTTGGNGVSRVKSDAGVLHGNILAKPYRPDELRMEIERILS